MPHAHRVPLPRRIEALARRFAPDLADVAVTTPPLWRMLPRLFAQSSSHDFERWLAEGRSFARWAAAELRRGDVGPGDAIFGYTGAALELLDLARDRGAQGVIGQVSPGFSWYDIEEQEAARQGHGGQGIRPDPRYVDRVTQEWDRAGRIIVNSRFSSTCLVADGVPADKITIAAPPIAPMPRAASPKSAPGPGAPLRVLFVGTLCFAKGIAYFGAVARRLAGPGFAFSAAGGAAIPDGLIDEKGWPMTRLGHLGARDLEQAYATHHVLVFPTLCDGFGLVQVEAQARGLPVIATTACGDVVLDRQSGFVVPPRDADALEAALWALREDPDLFEAMSETAIRASVRFSPDAYADALLGGTGPGLDMGEKALADA